MDTTGNLWIGSSRGLIKFDGLNWTVYNIENSSLTSNLIYDIDFDKTGNLWCGLGMFFVFDDNHNPEKVTEGGLAKYDGNDLYIYNTSNSVLPYNNVTAIAIDSENIIWLSARDPGGVGKEAGWGLTKFDGSNWTTYNIYNSPLTSNTIFDITVDKDDILWLSTCAGGLVKYDRKESWTIYNIHNSGIAFDSQNLVAIDSYGNKWIGHNMSGLSIFREGWLVLTDIAKEKGNNIPKTFSLYQNYPNPFNPVTTIEFKLPKTSNVILTISNILGEEVTTLVSDWLPAGSYSYNWNAGDVASGVYIYQLETDDYIKAKKMVLIR